MLIDLRTLQQIAGRPAAVEAAVVRLREIAESTFASVLSAIDEETLRRDPARFHAASQAVAAAIDAMRDARSA